MSASDLRSRFNGSPGANSAEALFAVDVNQRIIAWNAEAARVFGYAAATAIGDACYRLVSGRDQLGQRFCRLQCPVIRAARIGDAPPTVRLRARARDGTAVAVDVSTIVLAAGDGPGSLIHLCRAAGLAPALESETGVPSQLTSRERQVLFALCRGCSTDAIAGELGVSVTTVRNHIQHLLAKLSAHSRAEAVALAYREGLIS